MNDHSLHNWTAEQIKSFWDYESNFPQNYWGRNCSKAFKRQFGKLIKNSKTIVDLGCGSGDLMHALLIDSRSQQTFFGIEPSINSRQTAESLCNKFSNFLGCFDSVDSFLKNHPQPDLIIVSEVVEHLYDEDLKGLFSDVLRLMSEKTTLIITTPNEENLSDNYIYNPIDGSLFHRWQHVRSWSAKSLSKFLKDNGIASVETVETNILWNNSHLLKNLVRRFRYRERTSLFCIARR